jgi:hypothetical protein
MAIYFPGDQSPQVTKLQDRLSEGLKQYADTKLQQVLEQQQYKQNQQRAREQRSEIEKMLISSNVNPQDAKFISAIPTKDWGRVLPKLMQSQQQQQQQQMMQSPEIQSLLEQTGQQVPTRNASMAPQGQPLTQQTAQMTDLNAPIRQQRVDQTKNMIQQQQQQQFNQLNPLQRMASGSVATSKQQEKVNAENSKYNKALEDDLKNRDKAVGALESMYRLWEGKKISQGWGGALKPHFMLNEESQAFEGAADELASAMLKGGGAASAFKIKFVKGTKPSVSQKREAQLMQMKRNFKQFQKISLLDSIRQKLIDQNGGNQPKNLDILVRKEYNKTQNNPYNYGVTFDLDEFMLGQRYPDAPSDASLLKNGKKYVIKNGMWRLAGAQ